MGLNGAGKSSVAKELSAILMQRGLQSIILDGNHLRKIFEQNSYDRASRIALGIRYSQLAKTLSEQSSKVVIIAANGMLDEVGEYNRAHLDKYIEVFLDVPLEILQKRDSANIYTNFKQGLIKNVGGLDLEVDIPNAHLHFKYDSSLKQRDIALKIDEYIRLASFEEIKPPSSTILSTKAKTLSNLKSKLKHGKILPMWTISKLEFVNNFKSFYDGLKTSYVKNFIIRSSAKSEDTSYKSNAGAFKSLLNIDLESMQDAIREVFMSYLKDDVNATFSSVNDDEIVLIQPMLDEIICSGVIFNVNPKNNAPYYVIEYALNSADAITSGSNLTQTFYISKSCANISNPMLDNIIKLAKDIECIITNIPLDIEFGITKDAIYCFQVRTLVLESYNEYPSHEIQLELLKDRIDDILKPHPFLYGDFNMLGIMPDWNPAEIIGLHPKPLAFSLYAELITNNIYAKQRAYYGYRDVSSNPLIYNLHGKPYVDIRASFNSFIPNSLDKNIAIKLVNYYMEVLRNNPYWHDKVEFNILFDSYYFDTNIRLNELKRHSFSDDEIGQISTSLKDLTNNIISNKIYNSDIAKLDILSDRRNHILSSMIKPIQKLYWLLKDCKTYGTTAFIGLARIGFMAMGFLNTLQKEGILNKEQKDNFISSLDCITTQLNNDLFTLSKEAFLAKYGHLRPGTYDILSPRYDEAFEHYFKYKDKVLHKKEAFVLSLKQMQDISNLLKEHDVHCDMLEFLNFIQTGIIYREYAKFEFSKNLSEALSIISNIGSSYGLSAEDMSYCDVNIFFKAYNSSSNIERLILEQIEYAKSSYQLQKAIILPPLISSSLDVDCFYIGESIPNFITQKRVLAPIALPNQDINGKIVCISSADPGFDWIFSHNIAGLVTEFGGANSHMAIRANELGIPAVIGCGEKFEIYIKAAMLDIDCANSKIEVV